MNQHIFSQCVFDVDDRYIDLSIRKVYGDDAFMLTVGDTSNDEHYNAEIELYLTQEDLKLVIDRLTAVLSGVKS